MENQGALESGMRDWARQLFAQKASENPQVGLLFILIQKTF